MLSLIPQNTKNLAHCDYNLRIFGEDSWPLQYLFYDHIERRRAFHRISEKIPKHPTKNNGEFHWSATPLEWIQVLGMHDGFEETLALLGKCTNEYDFQSQDRLAHISSARQFMRRAYMTTTDKYALENVVSFVSEEVSQAEFDSLIDKRYVIGNTGFPIGTKSNDDKIVNGIHVKTLHCNAVEKALLELKNEVFTVYPSMSLFEYEYEKRHKVFEGPERGINQIRKHYAPARKAAEEIFAGGHSTNKHYLFLASLM